MCVIICSLTWMLLDARRSYQKSRRRRNHLCVHFWSKILHRVKLLSASDSKMRFFLFAAKKMTSLVVLILLTCYSYGKQEQDFPRHDARYTEFKRNSEKLKLSCYCG